MCEEGEIAPSVGTLFVFSLCVLVKCNSIIICHVTLPFTYHTQPDPRQTPTLPPSPAVVDGPTSLVFTVLELTPPSPLPYGAPSSSRTTLRLGPCGHDLRGSASPTYGTSSDPRRKCLRGVKHPGPSLDPSCPTTHPREPRVHGLGPDHPSTCSYSVSQTFQR